MIADTRTNAGVDHVCIFKTLHIFQTPGERVTAVAWAGTLSLTQSMLPVHAARPSCQTIVPDHRVRPSCQTILSILTEGLLNPETCEMETPARTPSLFRSAQLIAGR